MTNDKDEVVEFKDIEEDEDDTDAFRIEEIDVTTKDLQPEEPLPDYDYMEEEEEDLDDLEFPGIDKIDTEDEGE